MSSVVSDVTLRGRLASAEGIFGVPDGSISTNKLANGSVTTQKLAANAVTPDKISPSTSITDAEIDAILQS